MMFTIKTVTTGPTCQEFINNLDGSKLFCKLPVGHAGAHTADVQYGELSWEPKVGTMVEGAN
jgi:hypothetical protein